MVCFRTRQNRLIFVFNFWTCPNLTNVRSITELIVIALLASDYAATPTNEMMKQKSEASELNEKCKC